MRKVIVRVIRKYMSALILEYKKSSDYRFDFCIEILCTIISICALYFLWKQVFIEKQIIQDYTFDKILLYIVVAKILTILISPNFVFDIMYEIQGGEIQHYICRPINYILYYFFKYVGSKVKILVILIPMFLCIYILKASTIIDFSIAIYVFMNIILAFIFYFELAMFVSLSSFWFYEISSWYYTLTFIIEFLSGSMFPLALFSKKVRAILSLLPFQYLIFYPTDILVNGEREIEKSAIFILFIWIMIFGILLKIIWHRGVNRYELIGG